MAKSCVNSMADLKALPAGAVSCLTVLGYYAPGDIGGGDFYWDSSSTEPDNGGTVIVPGSNPAAGRWKRLIEGPLSVKWFGAIGDGATNDHDAIQNAIIAACATDTKAGAVYFPGGNLDAMPASGAYVTTTLKIASPTVLVGDGRDKSSLILSAGASDVLLNLLASTELRGLRFDGAAGPNLDLIIFQGDTGNLVMNDCCVLDPKANGLHAVRVNNALTVSHCDFRFRSSGAYPSVLLLVEYSTVDGGTLSIADCNFINPTEIATRVRGPRSGNATADQGPSSPGPGAILLQGQSPSSAGGSDGLSANISGNYFYQVGTNGSDHHPLGCIDIYNWVGRTVIRGNRMYKPTYSGIKIGNNGGYGVFADGNYDNSGLRLSVSDCLFYSSAAITVTHICLQSKDGTVFSADIRDNRLRGTPEALVVVSANKLWLFDNQAETNTIKIGLVTNGVLHGGNSWDAATANWAIGLPNLGSYTASVPVAGANPGDTISVGYDAFPAGLLGGGLVIAAGTAQVTLFNAAAAFSSTIGSVRVAASRPIHVERLCTTSSVLRRVSRPGTESALSQIRRLRDEFVVHHRHGEDLTQLVDVAGPVLAQAIQEQRDATKLREAIALLLISTFHENADLKAIAKQLSKPMKSMHELLTALTRKGGPAVTNRLISRAVKFIREDVGPHADFERVMASVTKILDEETDRVLRKTSKRKSSLERRRKTARKK